MKGSESLIEQNQNIDLLRFATAGSVDDGKSTLIGRLLYDSKSIFEDQLNSIKNYSKAHRDQDIDYSLVTDGLKSEREQGITIDVAYRFYSTPKRRFIIADTPGHEQYTRNMATGASNASLALILIDARNGVMTQTRRHTFISSLLGIRHFVVAVNKMDLVDYSEEVFDSIVNEYNTFTDKLSAESIYFIPLSALKGDNVIERSDNMPWYQGSTLLDYLENVNVSGGRNLIDFRFPVQYVNWSGNDFRGYCGTISSGVIRKGEKVRVLPSGKTSEISRIVTYEGDLDYAFAPMAVTLCLKDDIDISRSDVIARAHNLPAIVGSMEANLVWMDAEPMEIGKDYLIKHTTNTIKGQFTEVVYMFDPEDIHRKPADFLKLNDIGKVSIELKTPIFADIYSENKSTGSFIIIDPHTNQTAAAGMISKYKQVSPDKACESVKARVIRYPGDKKAEAQANYDRLSMQGTHCIYVDDDVLFEGLCKGVPVDSEKYSNTIENLCNIVTRSGVSVVLCSECFNDRS
ncbi:sulfate adenylyltransferase subunit CysN [Methanococcoides orientis]|uniref:sulfate adenylyltransferase subunit CysN n=1 Tax=Methanococcoides orientis TaxID=2822137 RepID=UPI001E4B8680|nr:sulfate adenylyltransferase subunit CysN [Methanococcoides orientis]UGV40310.1 sulfate adenylyltransferase subunit CysN [Methanococcoides orientis]